MRHTDTAELYVQATPEQVARALLPRTVVAGTTVTAEGGWHATPWAPRRDAWRRAGRWERGRMRGRTTVDLVPADAERTLVLVTFTSGRRGSAARGGQSVAGVLARRLRTLAEGRAATIVPSPHRRGDAATTSAPGRPAAVAVGYSGP